ncbi:tRNA pseudouridine(38-40) synthase TruA [Acetobacterium carbinolicum]|jgi:tRNA pseudouridine38-40 synthase|uniref:tRNA pseudouridine(38-40) synthase TruA n=1 Tax=Acetobacterium TaxID=33951 RepID=UPI0029E7339F|nr:tRNA pseudouridine(38-40) synthase TruA [Acetobacterium sp. K1/6]MDK2942396.1 tRNA pseudouridine38-40 synthase [Acetobacterium sp.]MDZ5725365.1 tRNA pseudouridine(38-40) synthase TruA [Acetobacterium sp. K1/6]
MRNIQIIISYRGTSYCGWQVQPNGVTIQEVIIRAIKELTGETVNLTGSGRTDAGVHALGQSANFFTASTIPPEVWYRALNTRLPVDIRVIRSRECPPDFHSRYNTIGKSYLYKILESPVASPFLADLAFHITRTLDWGAMEEAAAGFLGEHDFSAFMASGSAIKSTVRTITDISFIKRGELSEITFTGNGFLYNMVRIMMGTLYEVGYGRLKPQDIKAIIAGKDRNKAGVTAPAHGLYLKEVYY